jgi:outer membrane protein insertion porin family
MSSSRSFPFLALSFLYAICLNAAAMIIESVEIEGTRRPLELQTRRNAPLDLATVNADVRRLYGTGWFDDIRVEQPSPGRLVFHVVEQPRLALREVRFEPAEQKRKVKIGPGTPIDELLAQRMASNLRRELVADGYSYASVEPDILPVAYGTADLLLKVESGPVRNIGQVRFTGTLGLEEKQLRKALREVRVKIIVPLLWKHRPGFSDKALDADMARLRSLYLTHGYFDAEIGPAEVSHEDGRSIVTIPIDSGERHDLEITLEGIETDRVPNTMKDLCNCLLAERREAEREGRIDFDVQISLRERANPEPTVVAASVEVGEPFRLGRLDFRGHHSVGDSTLRRTMKIDEGDLFNPRKLEKSIARIDRLGVFEGLGDENIAVVRNSARGLPRQA